MVLTNTNESIASNEHPTNHLQSAERGSVLLNVVSPIVPSEVMGS